MTSRRLLAGVVLVSAASLAVTATAQASLKLIVVNRNHTTNSPITTKLTAKPGDVVESCAIAMNATGSPMSAITLSLPLPLFGDYVAGSLTLDDLPLTDAADADAGQVQGGTVTVRMPSLALDGVSIACYRLKVR